LDQLKIIAPEDFLESSENQQTLFFYRIQFRKDGQQFTAQSSLQDLKRDQVVMVKAEQGLEPATIMGSAPACHGGGCKRSSSYEAIRLASNDEQERYKGLPAQEQRAKNICNELVEKHKLLMSLIRVERFFNGSKIIFYFTAENRVDFRGLVKDLVQEFRTRVEMRQVGVRHETKMVGGMGTCGRELCCSSYMKKFDSVSIKMAKEQDLPLNPSKISGVCNRLLCCLTYAYTTYKQLRKGMPKPGRRIKIDDQLYKVKNQNPLERSITVEVQKGEQLLLQEDQWRSFELVKTEKPTKTDAQDKSSEKKYPDAMK